MNNQNSAFAEGVPSLFIVETPFQAMCAINAIKQLKIEDYELSLHLHNSTTKRNKQTIEIVERYGLKYTILEVKSVSIIKRLGLLFCHKDRFNRVFLGTHLYQDGYYYALKDIRRKGNLVLLDDGIATLTLLENGYKVTGRSVLYMTFNKFIASLRRVKLNNVFTVYKDKNNPKWNIAYNNISLLRQSDSNVERKNVFFIGTNNSGFIREGVNETEFRQTLFNILKQVKEKYPHEEITYIPHGRDKSTFAKDFCEEIGIVYKPLDVNIEIYILSLDKAPNAIYGFTSSALYNFKMIFPESTVNNIVIKLLSDNSPSILNVSDYYERQGINMLFM